MLLTSHDMQAWTYAKALAELEVMKRQLAQLCAQEGELHHYGQRLYQLSASHNTDLASCEHVSLVS